MVRIVLLNGTPGIGKTTLAAAAAISWPDTLHLQFDEIRETLGISEKTHPAAEDAINWQAFTRSVDHLRAHPTGRVILDSTGGSRRIPYLRFALGDYPQVRVRLTSTFPYNACSRKWGNRISPARFQHLAELVNAFTPDYEISIDGRSVVQLLEELTDIVFG